jgi:hypothetical protein
MAQLSEPKTASRSPVAALLIPQRAAALRSSSLWRRIIVQMRDLAPRTGKQNFPPKTLEMPILPNYSALRDRN